jgi:ribose transport system substrate-binding protein
MRTTKVALICTAAVIAGVGAGCGSSSDSSSSSDTSTKSAATAKSVSVGLSTPVKVSGPLKLALFSYGDLNTTQDNGHAAAVAAVKKAGGTLDFYDAKADPGTQAAQMRTALQSGKYNAFVVQAQGPQTCNSITKDAPAKNILVTAIGNNICGKILPIAKSWRPGLLSMIGGTYQPDAFKLINTHVVKDNPGPQQLVTVGGVPSLPFSIGAKQGTAEVLKSRPDIKNNGVVNTNYTTADAYTKSLAYLQAHKDTTIMETLSADITPGVIKAIDQLGLQKKVKVYEWGCSAATVPLIKAGKLQGCRPSYPRHLFATGVQAIVDARAGKKVVRVYTNDGNAGAPDWVDKSSAGSFKPEF